MDERRRFQIALGGIASCLLIAALFITSAPPLSYPAVPRLEPRAAAPFASARPLPEPANTPTRIRVSRGPYTPRAVLRSRSISYVVPTREVMPSPPPSAFEPLSSRPRLVALAAAPDTRGEPVALPSLDRVASSQDVDSRGPVTGAFVIAGKEVGRGFRTAGRAIRGIF